MTRIEHYKGSLDFPCDCCDTNSYDNWHFYNNDEKIVFVACLSCLKKAVNEVSQ